MHHTTAFSGLRLGVVGMARSGVAAAVLAARYGADVFVSESAAPERVAAAAARLEAAGIPYEAGGHSERLFASDLLVVSPGVPPHAPPLRRAEAEGIPIIGELELAYRVARCRIVAVTGSNGKTTTTALVAALLEGAGMHAVACGNIGLPFSAVADDLAADDVAVVEASSYQLATIAAFRPDVAVLLNLQPDHLDWHGSLEAYRAAKHRIAQNQGPADALVLNADDPALAPEGLVSAARRYFFSLEREEGMAAFVRAGVLYCRLQGEAQAVLATSELLVPGRHNVANAAAAVLAAALSGADVPAMADALRSFRGIEHRLEDCGRVGAVRFVNDSKATNVDATCTAVRAIEAPLHLILGGRDKGAPYTPIVAAGGDRVRSVVVLGEAADRIERDLAGAFPLRRARDLEEAVALAAAAASAGDVVLLSPACSSFDMFEDFEARGRAFKAAVAAMRDRPGPGVE